MRPTMGEASEEEAGATGLDRRIVTPLAVIRSTNPSRPEVLRPSPVACPSALADYA